MNARLLTGTLALVVALAIALPASAQIQRGAIYGTIMDNTGAVLPGVTVTLSSAVKAPLSIVSGAQGEFRFGELDPGVYTITASMDGFAPFKRENIVISVGSNVQLPVQLALKGVQQEVTVTAPTPLLDERAHGNATSFGDAVLNEVPTARDPWVLLQQVPGVLVDRVNVGGSESGQQSTFTARGDNGNNTMWNIDGVTITDMGAIGSSPTYYNFDVFQEVQFTTGGLDPRQQTGSLGINMVTKRGTNGFHGLARYFFDNHNLQSDNLPSNLPRCAPGVSGVVGCYAGNQINQIADYGGDIGGPVVKDRLWFWGSAARNDIRNIAITGAPDNTKLTNYAAKADFQATPGNHLNFLYFRGDKVKIGRNASVTRPPETTWNQAGPTDIYKIEDNHTFGQHLMVTGRYAHVSGGFSLVPQGGLSQEWRDPDGVYHGSYYTYKTDRPQDQVNGDANYFRGMHELKVGFGYRRTPVSSSTSWPFSQYTATSSSGATTARLYRSGNTSSIQQDTSVYGGDTISLKRVTLDLSVRYDRQNGYITAASVAANPLAPDVLPALSFGNLPPAFTWNSVSPRAGATFRVNDKTNVRASYSYFQGQLPSAFINANNPVQVARATYNYADPGNHVPTVDNIDFSTLVSHYGFDPANPAALKSVNTIDPDLKAPRTHAVLVALDRELMANFAVSTSFGYGRTNDVVWQTYPGLTSADFVQIGTIGTVQTAMGPITSDTPYYGLAPGVVLPSGSLLTNRQGYYQSYWNWDVTATKRLSNRWMMRAYLTLQNHQEYFTNPSLAIQDPTPLAITGSGTASAGYESQPEFTQVTMTSANLDGGIVPLWGGNASGNKQDVFMQAKWSYSVLGLYQFGHGFQASGTVYGRQGYPSPYYFGVNRHQLGSNSPVLVSTDMTTVRLPNVNLLDLRAEQSFGGKGFNAILSVDAFNVFNTNTALQVNRNITSALFGQQREIVAPRIFRLGVRFTF